MKKICWLIVTSCLLTLPNISSALDVRIFDGIISLPSKYRLDLEHLSYVNDGNIVFNTFRSSPKELPTVYDGVVEFYSLKKQTIHRDGFRELIEKHQSSITSKFGFNQLVVNIKEESYNIVLFFDDETVIQIIDTDPDSWEEILASFRKVKN